MWRNVSPLLEKSVLQQHPNFYLISAVPLAGAGVVPPRNEAHFEWLTASTCFYNIVNKISGISHSSHPALWDV